MKKSDIKLNQLNNMNIKVNTNSIDITIDNTTHSIHKEEHNHYSVYIDNILSMGLTLFHHKEKVQTFKPEGENPNVS